MAMTDADLKAIAQAVALLLYQQAEATAPIPKQPDLGHILAQTYNKAGDLQSRMSTMEADIASIKKALMPADV